MSSNSPDIKKQEVQQEKTTQRVQQKLTAEEWLIEQLKNGIIPQEIIEEGRYVSLEAEATQLFQQEMLVLARECMPDWDFEADPVRFVISDKEQANAEVIRVASPPIIAMQRGLFDKANKTAPKNRDALLGILRHEFFHIEFGRKTDAKASSKPEEGAADIAAINCLQKIGRDPKQYLRCLENLHQHGHKPESYSQHIERICDTHPLTETRISIAQAQLTKIEQGHGELVVKPSTKGLDKLAEITQSERHTSYFSALCKRASFKTMPLAAKITFLKQAIEKNKNWYQARMTSVLRLLENLNISEKSLSNTESTALEKLAEYIFARIQKLSKKHEELVRKHPYVLGNTPFWRNLYKSLSVKLSKKSQAVALGRLEKINQAMAEFIIATGDEEIKIAATKICELIDNEPLANYRLSLHFLQSISWQSYPLPTKIGQTVSWNARVKKAIAHAEQGFFKTMRALIEMGVEDPRLYSYMNDGFAMFILGRNFLVTSELLFHDYYAGISKGRRRTVSYRTDALKPLANDSSVREGDIGIQQVITDSRGIVLQMPEDIKSLDRINKETCKDRYSSFVRRSLIEKVLADDSKKRRIRAYNLGQIRRICENKRIVAGIQHAVSKPNIFVMLNTDATDAHSDEQKIIIKEIEDKIKTLRKAARTLTGKQIALQIESTRNSHDESNAIPARRPITKFVLGEKAGIFSKNEKLQLLFKVIEGATYRHELEAAPDNMKLVLPPKLCRSIKTWREAIELMADVYKFVNKKKVYSKERKSWDTYRSDPFLGSPRVDKRAAAGIAEVALYDLNSFPPPTLNEICDFLEICEMPHVYRADGTKNVFDLFMTITTQNISWSQNTKRAVHQWCILKESRYFIPADQVYPALNILLSRLTDSEISIKERIACLEKILSTDRIADPDLRQKTRELWVNSIQELHGIDDGSKEYRANIEKVIAKAKKFKGQVERGKILDILAKSLLTQGELTKVFYNAKKITFPDKYKAGGIQLISAITEFHLDELRKSKEGRRIILDFLTRPLTENSTDTFLQKLFKKKNGDGDIYENASQEVVNHNKLNRRIKARRSFENFWSLPLDLRAVAVRELLFPIDQVDAEEEQDSLNYMFDTLITEDNETSREFRTFLEVYAEGLPDYRKPLFLSALMGASEPSLRGSRSLGHAIAMIAAILGPGENKCVQGGHSYPGTPKNIRDDLKISKYKAAEPTRCELFEMIDAKVPNQVRSQIAHIGKVKGSASFYVTVEVTLNSGEKAALKLLRTNAAKRAEYGLKLLRTAAEKRAAADRKFDAFVELCDEAEKAWKDEVDPELSAQKVDAAYKHYHGVKINVSGEIFTVDAPQILDLPGVGRAYGDEYRLETLLEETHFTELADNKDPPRSKIRKIAKALSVLELGGLLEDDDWHGGNVLIDGNRINRVDSGGFLLTAPSKDDLKEFGAALSTAIKNAKDPEKIADEYFNLLRDKRNKGESISKFLRRGLKSLLVAAEYQREFEGSDAKQVLLSILKRANPTVKKGMGISARSLIPQMLSHKIITVSKPTGNSFFKTN